MAAPLTNARNRTSLFKSVRANEHLIKESRKAKIPDTALTLGALKKVELAFWDKGVIADPRGKHLPLWFVAETERNTTLWRMGLGLDDLKNLEVWVDVPSLINKRLNKIEIEHDLGFFSGSPDEVKYLYELERASLPVLNHAHCLCRAITQSVPRDYCLVVPVVGY